MMKRIKNLQMIDRDNIIGLTPGRAATLIASIWAISFALFVFFIVYVCQGNLVYTLDDPYIHLSVAEIIVRGGYGVNYEEFSTPSSSIIYPFILAPLVLIGLGAKSSLFVNFVVTLASVWGLSRFFFWRTARHGLRWFHLVVALMLVICINSYSLPMSGMEHSLHVFAVVLVFWGLAELLSSDRFPFLSLFALAVLPFVRFEGMALSLASIVLIFACRRWKVGIAVLLFQIVGFYLWYLFTRHMDLPFFPSSVSSKSVAAADAQGGGYWKVILTFLDNFHTSSLSSPGVIFILFVGILFIGTRNQKWSSIVKQPKSLIAGVVSFALIAHTFAGAYGWFYRYEVYAVAILLVGSIYIFDNVIEQLCSFESPLASFGLLIILVTIGRPYIDATRKTPFASRGIYQQQYQMHRFATEYFPHRVAVNDLGFVSFKNDSFVLDLWGLGSESVRLAMAKGKRDKAFIQAISEQSKVDFAMIYPTFFKDSIPDDWCLMATLHTEPVTAASGEVAFYATNTRVVNEMANALARFGASLPLTATLSQPITQCGRN